MTLRLRSLGSLWFWLLPSLVISVALVFGPVVAAVGMGFTRMTTLVSPPELIGIANYASALRSAEFWRALSNGLIYAFGSIVGELVLGVSFALVLNQRFFGRAALRAVVVLPYVIPSAIGVITWKWILDENVGVITLALRSLHVEVPWFSRPGWAMAMVIVVSIWLWTPFVTLVTLAGLQTIPKTLYEAAEVDGANSFRRWWHISMPGLMPILVVVVLLRGIFSFNKFDVIWLATGGGPLDSTQHLPILAYQVAIGDFNLGQGAAIAGLNLLAVLILVLGYVGITRRASQHG